ncbi:hypothetical protein PHMEG_00025845 [Phytophthora megakarya]|uniref:Transmembrane protein n=1 Tax=Phytophthora megakarya TaxID=4795 RepID=A0A225VDK5_9STRA|nr:hypothetical protein PHMEG_00025845 [Phytophthora megakarya]
MDADDEPAMTYFLPNGIADDSPPKKSHIKASFGRIGGRSSAATSNQSPATSPGNTTAASVASGPSNSRSDVDFSTLHARPHPTLDPSPFGSSGGSASSPRPTNYLLSDLGGEIHTPRASRDFGDSGGSRSSSGSPFGFAGPFGSGISDTGTIGAIRSPSSMFDRGQEAAKSFSMQGERSIGSSASYAGGETQQLYRGGGMASYLGTGDSNSRFGSSSMGTWPSSTDAAQPRRVLQSPPGLVRPPGLGEPSDMSFGGGGDMMQQRLSGSQFGPFLPSASSPMAGAGGPNRTFSRDDQYGSSLLSSLRLPPRMFGEKPLHEQGVSNPDLAELNTHSMIVGEMDRTRLRQDADLSSAMWDNPETTTSRRIDIQARSKAPRSPKKARDGRRKPECRSDLRAKAVEFTMDAINGFKPGSPMRTRRSERARKPISPLNHDTLPPSHESSRNDQQPTRSKRRSQFPDKGSSSSLLSTGGNDSRRRGLTNQSEEPNYVPSSLPGLESSDSPIKSSIRESGKPRRREETKTSNRGSSRRNSTRATDKGTGTTRRQVYREKQAKETTKEPAEIIPTAALIGATSSSPQDVQKTESKLDNQKLSSTFKTKSNTTSPARSDDASEETKLVDNSPETVADVADLGVSKKSDQLHKNEERVTAEYPKQLSLTKEKSIATVAEISEDPAETASSTAAERVSSSSSELLEDDQDALDRRNVSKMESDDTPSRVESSESEAERPHTPRTLPPASNNKPVSNTGTEQVVTQREPSQVDKKHSIKEHRKEKSKKDKGEKKKTTRSKKDKRGTCLPTKGVDTANDSAAEAQDKLLEALTTKSIPFSIRIGQGLYRGGSKVASALLHAFFGTRRGCIWVASRLNVKGLLATTFSYAESVLAVVFSVVLLLSLHVASWFIRIHRVSFRAILTHRHIGFCFAFLYGFPFLVQYVFPWAPPWAPVCLWYAFLVQLFCTNGSTAMVTTFRVILPLVFLVEGISHHSFLLDLNGAELLLASFIISAVKTSNLCSPIFLLSLATQCLLAVFLGSELLVQWLQLALALYSLHIMAATDDDWNGMGDEEDDLSCHPVSMHHSIADYNHHPAPSNAVSIQKTKRLDRRALAYVRGRKLR